MLNDSADTRFRPVAEYKPRHSRPSKNRAWIILFQFEMKLLVAVVSGEVKTVLLTPKFRISDAHTTKPLASFPQIQNVVLIIQRHHFESQRAYPQQSIDIATLFTSFLHKEGSVRMELFPANAQCSGFHFIHTETPRNTRRTSMCDHLHAPKPPRQSPAEKNQSFRPRIHD